MKKFSLNDYKVQSPYQAPPGYFDTLPDVVMQKLPQRRAKRISRDRSWLWAAASVVLLSLSIPALDRLTQTDSLLGDESVENYLVTQSDIPSYELAENLDEAALANLNAGIDPEKIENALYLQDVEHYLNY